MLTSGQWWIAPDSLPALMLEVENQNKIGQTEVSSVNT